MSVSYEGAAERRSNSDEVGAALRGVTGNDTPSHPHRNYPAVIFGLPLSAFCVDSETPCVAKCRARNRWPPHNLCNNPVAKAGMRCYLHPGMPEGGPRPTTRTSTRRAPVRSNNRGRRRVGSKPKQRPVAPVDRPAPPVHRPVIPAPRPAAEKSEKGPKRERAKAPRRALLNNLTAHEQHRVEVAAAFCVDTLTDGWPEAVASRAADCITPKTWDRLFGKRRPGDCKVLADMAKSLLDGKKALHDLIGSVGSRVAGWMGGKGVECAVARELAQRIPIPVIDQKTVVVARGLQMIGILLCLSQGIPLNRCQSFIDLALAESKERVKQILVAAMDDWTSPSPTLLTPWRARTH